jgi:hypothetical protein
MNTSSLTNLLSVKLLFHEVTLLNILKEPMHEEHRILPESIAATPIVINFLFISVKIKDF